MKGKRFTEGRIIGVLRESEAGAATKELCRRYGINEQTFYRWNAKFGGAEVSPLYWSRCGLARHFDSHVTSPLP